MGDNARLAELTRPFIEALGGKVEGASLVDVIALVKDRANTLKEVAQTAMLFYRGEPQPDAALRAEHLTDEIRPALQALATQLAALPEWKREAINATFKAVLGEFGLKMPKLATPVRLLVAGQLQTPSIDAVLELFGRDTVLRRLAAA
ncbi:Glutamate--tRNA ligase [compost metagenome]